MFAPSRFLSASDIWEAAECWRKAGARSSYGFQLPKALNSDEDAHIKYMSTFETDEHLLRSQALLSFRGVDLSSMRLSSHAFVRSADNRAVREFRRWLASPLRPPLLFDLPGF